MPHSYLRWKAALQCVHRQSLHTWGLYPLHCLGRKQRMLSLKIKSILHSACLPPLLVQKYHSFIDKDSNKPAAKSTFMFDPWDVMGGRP